MSYKTKYVLVLILLWLMALTSFWQSWQHVKLKESYIELTAKLEERL